MRTCRLTAKPIAAAPCALCPPDKEQLHNCHCVERTHRRQNTVLFTRWQLGMSGASHVLAQLLTPVLHQLRCCISCASCTVLPSHSASKALAARHTRTKYIARSIWDLLLRALVCWDVCVYARHSRCAHGHACCHACGRACCSCCEGARHHAALIPWGRELPWLLDMLRVASNRSCCLSRG